MFALLDGFVGGGEADYSYGGGEDHFGVGVGGYAVHAFGAEDDLWLGRGFGVGVAGAGFFERVAEFAGGGFGGDGDELRLVFCGLFRG